MRGIGPMALAAAVAVTAAGCGGDSKGKPPAPVGPTFQATLAASKTSAARSALLLYAERHREAAGQELNRVTPRTAPDQPAPGPGAPGPAAPGPAGTPPGVGEAPIRGPGFAPPVAPVITPEMAKAQDLLSRWQNLIEVLKGPAASKCFTVQDSKVIEVKTDQATSRLVVRLADSYRDLVAEDLAFELRWCRVIRPAFPRGSAPKADWELSDAQEVPTGKESSPG